MPLNGIARNHREKEFKMPNNNPGGHNQYSKSDASSSKSQAPIAKSQQPGADGATQAHPAGPGALLASGSVTGDANAGASAPAPRSNVSKRGFASMDEHMQRIIASKGGHSQGRENNPGNFANDRERARTAGRKGGEAHGSNR